MELEALQDVHPEIEKAGGRVVAISPQQEKYSRQIRGKLKLDFPVLSDPGNRVAAEFGLVFTLPEELQKLYLEFGIDLVRFNGDENWQLPLPARFVIGQDSRVVAAEANPDYTQRPEPAELIPILEKLRS